MAVHAGGSRPELEQQHDEVNQWQNEGNQKALENKGSGGRDGEETEGDLQSGHRRKRGCCGHRSCGCDLMRPWRRDKLSD